MTQFSGKAGPPWIRKLPKPQRCSKRFSPRNPRKDRIMPSRAENALLTLVHAGTPMGGLFRRYWIPALLSEEIPNPDCPPVRVRLLGEDLVAFRDTHAQIGLLD